MKTALASILVALVLTACIKPQEQASMASAQRFASFLTQELRALATVQDGGSGGGQGDSVFTRDFTLILPTNSFSPDRLSGLAEEAKRKWGEYDKYSSSGSGGSDRHFRMHYGSGRSHAFVDAIAYVHGEKTKVHIFIRVVE